MPLVARISGSQKTSYCVRGVTSSDKGASSQAHVHDYHFDSDGYGYADYVADHGHRITVASFKQGKTEPSDGHTHSLTEEETNNG